VVVAAGDGVMTESGCATRAGEEVADTGGLDVDLSDGGGALGSMNVLLSRLKLTLRSRGLAAVCPPRHTPKT